jgi:pimeloyl-ACP methyl ester carboxylesterase
MPITANLYYTVNRQESGQYPVLLIHGAGGTHLHWPPEVRRLPGQPVFALDLPGHGKSTGLGQQSIPAYAGAILSWLDAMQINQAIFVGHSMGGAISQYLGLKNPDRTAGLGLVGTGARLRVLPSILENSANSLTFPSAVAEITSCSYAPTADPRLVELATARMLEIRSSVLHGDFLACDQFDIMQEVGEITAPTLILTGMNDLMTPPRYAQYLANKIPNARLVLIPDAGHMLMLEKPQIVARELLDFLLRLQ